MAEKYAELAKDSDSYNAAAFVNLANCSFEKVGKGEIKTTVPKLVNWRTSREYRITTVPKRSVIHIDIHMDMDTPEPFKSYSQLKAVPINDIKRQCPSFPGRRRESQGAVQRGPGERRQLRGGPLQPRAVQQEARLLRGRAGGLLQAAVHREEPRPGHVPDRAALRAHGGHQPGGRVVLSGELGTLCYFKSCAVTTLC